MSLGYISAKKPHSTTLLGSYYEMQIYCSASQAWCGVISSCQSCYGSQFPMILVTLVNAWKLFRRYRIEKTKTTKTPQSHKLKVKMWNYSANIKVIPLSMADKTQDENGAFYIAPLLFLKIWFILSSVLISVINKIFSGHRAVVWYL